MMIEKLVELRKLKPSDQLIWNYIYTAKHVEVECKDSEAIYSRLFQAFELATGQPNPDFTKQKPIKLGIQSRYARIKTYVELGLLIDWPNPIPSDYKSGRLKFYTPSYPALTSIEPLNDDAEPNETGRNIDTITDDILQSASLPIRHLGSFQMFANIIGRCVRADRTDKRKTLVSEFPIPSVNDHKAGKIKVTTSALDNSEIMLPEDLLLVDVVYSKIKELLRSDNGITYPARNSFTFDKVDIAAELDKRDSGAMRDSVHQQFERIGATEFDVESSEEARWLMKQFQFMNESGEAFDRKRIRWLTIEGEIFHKDIQQESDKKRSSRYITISLPEFLFNSINLWLKTRQGDILPMFSRDKKMIKQSSAGQVWTLNNYLNMTTSKPGLRRGPVILDAFLAGYIPHIGTQTKMGQLTFIKVLLESDRLIYAYNLTVNSRNQPRLNVAISLIGNHLLFLRNITPTASQLSRIRYEISNVRLTDNETDEAAKILNTVKNEPNLLEDEYTYKWAKTIYSTAGKY